MRLIKKYVFIDIDGTLRDHTAGIPESAIKAIIRARSKGHRFFICTGRTVGLIPDDVPRELFDGVIAGGGCYLEYKGEIMRERYIPDYIIGRYCTSFSENAIPFSLETKKRIYMSPHSKQIFLEKHSDGSMDMSVLSHISDMDDYYAAPVPASKISFLLTDEQYKAFENEFAEELTLIPLYRSDDGFNHLELIGAECDKGAAMKLFCEYTYIPPEDTVAFGDSMNDAAMFDFAALSVCMGNAPEAVMAHADMVTRDLLSDGLYLGFYKAGLFQI